MRSAFVALLSAPESHEPQLLDVDLTILVQFGLFLLLLAVLSKLLWKPYLRVRDERVSRVEGYREEAVRLEAEAKDRLGRAEAALGEARRMASGQRAVARAEAQAREQTVLAEATAAAQRTLREAREKLAGTVDAERGKLRGVAAETAREAARKILGREVTA
jgi:F-type H+-transporting ATPase subunit b